MVRNDRRKAAYLRFVGWAKDARLTRETGGLMELEAPSQSGRWRGLNPGILEWATTRTGCQRGKESGISKANIFWWCFKSGYKGEETVRGTVRVPPSVATRSRRTLRIYVIRNKFGENATRSNFPRRAILTYIRFFFQLRLYTLYDIEGHQ